MGTRVTSKRRLSVNLEKLKYFTQYCVGMRDCLENPSQLVVCDVVGNTNDCIVYGLSNLAFWFTNVCMGRRRRIWPRCWSTSRTILHSVDCEAQRIVDRENSSFLVRGWRRLDHEASPRLDHLFGTACQLKSPTRHSTFQPSKSDSKHFYSNSLSRTNRGITPAARAPLRWPCYKETL